MNVSEVLQSKFRVYSGKEAIIFEEKVITYDELYKAVNLVSELLKNNGVKKGDRIAIQLSKCVEIAYFHLAIMAVGAIALHVNDAYKAAEVEYILKDSESSLFIADAENYLKSKDLLENLPGLRIMTIDKEFPVTLFYPREIENSGPCLEPGYDAKGLDTAMIIYTSGTTGRAKGAMINHKGLVELSENMQEAWKLSSRDIFLHSLPLSHGHGLIALQIGLYVGATIILDKKFDAEEVWNTIEKEHCTVFMGVPTMYRRMLDAWKKLTTKPDICSMRLFVCGSAPLSGDLFDQFRDNVGYTILERYGTTEALLIATNPYEDHLRKANSVGYPFRGVAIRVVDDSGNDVTPGNIGEIYVKGGNWFNGYWKDEEKTKASFAGEWFKTGDRGYQDPEDGLRLYLVGRATEMIISGGYNVYPKEVENVLEKHPAVREAAVISLFDRDFGECVTAVVVTKEGLEIDEQELQAFCKNELASYKCPKKVIFVSELPRNTMGKIMKRTKIPL